MGLGVCEGGAPGRSELGLLCRGEVVGRGSLRGAREPYHERSPGAQSGCPHPDPTKPHSPCSWCPPVTYVHLEESSTHQDAVSHLIPPTGDLHPQTCPLLCRCLNGGDPTTPQARLETGPPPAFTSAPKSRHPGADSSHPQPLTQGPGAPIPYTDSQVSLPCPPPAPLLGHGRSASQWTSPPWRGQEL